MTGKRARDLVPGDVVKWGGSSRLRIVAPPEAPVRLHARQLDEHGNIVGTVTFTADPDDDVEVEG